MKNKVLKILLVENNLADANKISNMFAKNCDFTHSKPNIKHVIKIADAIQSLNQNNFDVILLNLFLADNKGIDSLKMLQQKAPQLPIIILTTTYDGNIAVTSLRRGAQDYLIKSELNEKILARSIQYAIERQRIEFNERQQALMKKMMDNIRQSIDLEKILQTAVDEIQQFLNAEQVLIYRCESNKPEDILIVSSSLDKESAQTIVAQFISISGSSSHNSVESQLICVQAVEEEQTNTVLKCLDLQSIKSYLSLPIHVGKFENSVYDDLTHPIIQSEEISKSSKELWGILIAYNTKTTRKWQDWEISFLQKLTTQVTIAIQQSQVCDRLQTANKRLKQLAILDGLTGVFNRRYFDLVLNNEWKRLTRDKQPLSLILCDIDHFKAYNDFYGHLQGDRCLQDIAGILQENTRRSTDSVARYGGEEFAIILPNTDARGALFIAKNIQKKLAQRKLPHIKSKVSQYVTCSMGISTIVPNLRQSVVSLIKSADKLLYQAKDLGRNQIAVNYQDSYQELNA